MASLSNPKVTGIYRDTLDVVCKARYVQKLIDIDGTDPYEMGKDEWSTDVNAYPAISYPDIVNYLVNSVSVYTLHELKGYKSLESYNYFVCGWVQEIRQATLKDKCVVIARIRHSQRSTIPCLVPWIISEKDGKVVSGHCTCMAGIGEICSHVGALLFAVEASVKMRDSRTVTEEKSYWLLPSAVKKVEYKTIQEINFTSSKMMKRKLDKAIETGGAPEPMTQRKLSDVSWPTSDDLSAFHTELKSNGRKPVLLSLIPGHAKNYRPEVLNKKYPLVLSELYDDTYSTADKPTLLAHCDNVFARLQVTDEEAKNCEIDTRSQADCKQWFRFRAGRITASRMKAACRTSSEAPSMSLLKAICYPVSKRFSNSATEWGCTHEKTARDQYQHQMKDLHTNFQLRDCGLVIDTRHPFIGATPDGIGSCDCCGLIILEVKCPYCHRNSLLTDSVDCLETRDGQLCLKRDHTYFYQVQCQLLVSSADCCDFVVWTKGDFFSERISLDEELCQEIVTKASILFRRAILPELVGKFFSRPTPMLLISSNDHTNIAKPSSGQLICICKSAFKEADGIISCENKDCPYTWHHLKCVNMKKIPKRKWFCKECKPKTKK